MPMGIEEFSYLVSTVLAIFAVGVVALLFGQCLMMVRVRRPWWVGLIPGYNLYVLFSAARCQVLFALYVIDAALVYGFWTFPRPEDQELIWWPLLIGVFMVMWMSLCLAGRMRLGFFWRLFAFLLPSFAWCLMGLLPRHIDPDFYPWSVKPFLFIERLIFMGSREEPPKEEPQEALDDGDETAAARAEAEFAEGSEESDVREAEPADEARELEVVGDAPEAELEAEDVEEVGENDETMVISETERSIDAEPEEAIDEDGEDEASDREGDRDRVWEDREDSEEQEALDRRDAPDERDAQDDRKWRADERDSEDFLDEGALSVDLWAESEVAEDAGDPDDLAEATFGLSATERSATEARFDVTPAVIAQVAAKTGAKNPAQNAANDRPARNASKQVARDAVTAAPQQSADLSQPSESLQPAEQLQATQAFAPLQETTQVFGPLGQITQQIEFVGFQDEQDPPAESSRSSRPYDRSDQPRRSLRRDRRSASKPASRRSSSQRSQNRRSQKRASQALREAQSEPSGERPELDHYSESDEVEVKDQRSKGYAVSDKKTKRLSKIRKPRQTRKARQNPKPQKAGSSAADKRGAEPVEASKQAEPRAQQAVGEGNPAAREQQVPEPNEEAYEKEAYSGKGFDPVGDAREEVDRRSRELNRRMHELLDDEDELLEEEYVEDDNPYDRAFAPREPMSDLSDEVSGQIEGVFAEQLGMPEVTQDVDAEEAAYMEEDAAYAREQILEETHDLPNAQGYSGKHLSQAVREMEEASGEPRFRSKGAEPEDERSRDARLDESRAEDESSKEGRYKGGHFARSKQPRASN